MKMVARVASVAFICILLVLCASRPAAAQLTYGPAISLTTLTNSGETLLVGDKVFSNFFTVGDSYASNIMVQTLISNGNYGLAFSGGFAASYGNDMDFRIGYMVGPTNGSPNLISGADLAFNGVVLGSGPALAEVTETVDTNMDIAVPYGQMSVFVTPSSQVLSTNMAINPPQPYLNLSKDVLVNSFTITAYSSISEIDQLYVQIPEPSTVVLVGLSLLGGLAVWRRRN